MTDRGGERPSSSADDRGHAENRARADQDRDDQFRALVEAVEEYAIFRLDPEGTVVSWNPGAERLKGYAAEEIVGEHFSAFYTATDRAADVPAENLAKAAERGSIEDEGWRVRADGSRFWANVTITAIRDDDGAIDGFAKVTRDLTDRKRAREERQLHLSVSRSVAEAATLEEGLQAAVEDICAWTDCVVGQAWVPTADGTASRLPVAYVKRAEFAPFVETPREYTFNPGEGIPGRVVESGEPVWFPDVTAVSEAEYPRTASAADVGLKAGLGVPVIVEDAVAVVLEFYLAEQRPEDERLVELISSVTADLGGLVARKQIEDDLHRERELLAEMMEAAPVGISVLTADGAVERMNERARSLRSTQGGDAEGREAGLPPFYDEEGRPVDPDERPFARVIASGEPVYDWTAQVELPDGRRKWLSIDAAPIAGDDGEIERVVVIDEDVTELRQQYRAITEAITDVIVTIDENSVIRSINPAVEDVFGYTRAELTGESLTVLMPDGYDERHRVAISRYIETGERTLDWDYVELPGKHADGREFPLAISFSEIRYGGERFFTGVIRDISERKEYQRRLEESNERLEQFAYAASHDLQEPLRMVSSYLQLVEDRYADELDDGGREFIEFAVDGAERMREMIDGLLEYSRVETQGDPFEPVDLERVLDDVLEDLQFRIAESAAEITRDPLPTVGGDRDQLRQVFQNLLDNAIEYSGDEPPRIHVGAREARSGWTISVRDDGIGLDPAEADRIFEVFQRLHTSEEHPGTGIGLALCRRIVERHGGDIWVESSPGEGATFGFTLPASSDG